MTAVTDDLDATFDRSKLDYMSAKRGLTGSSRIEVLGIGYLKVFKDQNGNFIIR